jgi:hypothetical protein
MISVLQNIMYNRYRHGTVCIYIVADRKMCFNMSNTVAICSIIEFLEAVCAILCFTCPNKSSHSALLCLRKPLCTTILIESRLSAKQMESIHYDHICIAISYEIYPIVCCVRGACALFWWIKSEMLCCLCYTCMHIHVYGTL